MNLLLKGDVQGSIALLSASAEGGDAVAMFWLGRCSAEVGVAAWSAGRLHEMGRGASQDSEEAQSWYRKAAELGLRRTALTVIKLRWFPGTGALQ